MARRPETVDLARAAHDLLGHPSLRSGQADAVTETDRLTVLFDREGYRVLSLEAVCEDGLLETA